MVMLGNASGFSVWRSISKALFKIAKINLYFMIYYSLISIGQMLGFVWQNCIFCRAQKSGFCKPNVGFYTTKCLLFCVL